MVADLVFLLRPVLGLVGEVLAVLCQHQDKLWVSGQVSPGLSQPRPPRVVTLWDLLLSL